jgi:hypothetical protein
MQEMDVDSGVNMGGQDVVSLVESNPTPEVVHDQVKPLHHLE